MTDIYAALRDITTTVRDGLGIVTTIGQPSRETPIGPFAWVEPAGVDESSVGGIDHAINGNLEFRVHVRVPGLDLQDKMERLCQYVDRNHNQSVQRTLLAADFADRMSLQSAVFGIDVTDGELGVTVSGSLILG